MALTKQQREDLKVELDAIDVAQKPIMALMESLREAIAGMEEVRGITLLRYGLTEPPETCESCEAFIIPGDMYHSCQDGELLCEACAPDWEDMKRQSEERLADSGDDGHEGAQLTLRNVESHLANGGSLADKCVHEFQP